MNGPGACLPLNGSPRCSTTRSVRDPLLAPVFAEMDAHHPRGRRALPGRSLRRAHALLPGAGRSPSLLRQHFERHLTEPQRRQWVSLLIDSADEARCRSTPNSGRPSWHTLSGGPGWPCSTHNSSSSQHQTRRCRSGDGEYREYRIAPKAREATCECASVSHEEHKVGFGHRGHGDTEVRGRAIVRPQDDQLRTPRTQRIS